MPEPKLLPVSYVFVPALAGLRCAAPLAEGFSPAAICSLGVNFSKTIRGGGKRDKIRISGEGANTLSRGSCYTLNDFVWIARLFNRPPCLCNLFQIRIAFFKEMPHMRLQKQFVRDYAQNAERGGPGQGIGHDSSGTFGSKLMEVPQGFEGSAQHLVGETVGRIEFRDAGGEALSNAEMHGLKGHLFPQPDQAGRHSGNGTLLGACGRPTVQFYVARKVKADLNRHLNIGFDSDGGHRQFQEASG